MKKTWVGLAFFALGISAPVLAETAVIEQSTTTTPGAAPASIIILPVTSVQSTNAMASVSIPVAVPVDSQKNLNTVAWKELSGSVQSVDRQNLAMTVQDSEGKDIFLTMNDHLRIYKGGTQVAYADIEPNDRIKVSYKAD